MKSKSTRSNPAWSLSALILLALPTAALGQNYTWSGTLNGTAESWDVDANWSGTPNLFPNLADDIANLTGDFTAAKTVSLNADTTVGTLSLNDTGAANDVAITLAPGTPGGNLIFDVSTLDAALTSAGATNVISSGILLNDNLNVTATNNLTLSGLIGEGVAGKNLVKLGASTLTLSNNSNSYTGTTSIFAGGITAILNADIPLSTNSVLGNSAAAVQLGTAGTVTSGLTFNAGSDSANYTMSRGLDLSQQSLLA